MLHRAPVFAQRRCVTDVVPSIPLLIDENVPRASVEHLRACGYAVIWIAEVSPGVGDPVVLTHGRAEVRPTFGLDLDLPERIVRGSDAPPLGLVLFRDVPASPSAPGAVLEDLLRRDELDLLGHITVVKRGRVRQRPFPTRVAASTRDAHGYSVTRCAAVAWGTAASTMFRSKVTNRPWCATARARRYASVSWLGPWMRVGTRCVSDSTDTSSDQNSCTGWLVARRSRSTTACTGCAFGYPGFAITRMHPFCVIGEDAHPAAPCASIHARASGCAI